MIFIKFNVVLRLFNLRYKFSIKWELNPRPSNFCSDALPTELASLQQGQSNSVDVCDAMFVMSSVMSCLWDLCVSVHTCVCVCVYVCVRGCVCVFVWCFFLLLIQITMLQTMKMVLFFVNVISTIMN